MNAALVKTKTSTLSTGESYTTKVIPYRDHSIELDIWGASVYSPTGKFLQNFRFRPTGTPLLDMARDYINHRTGK